MGFSSFKIIFRKINCTIFYFSHDANKLLQRSFKPSKYFDISYLLLGSNLYRLLPTVHIINNLLITPSKTKCMLLNGNVLTISMFNYVNMLAPSLPCERVSDLKCASVIRVEVNDENTILISLLILLSLH